MVRDRYHLHSVGRARQSTSQKVESASFCFALQSDLSHIRPKWSLIQLIVQMACNWGPREEGKAVRVCRLSQREVGNHGFASSLQLRPIWPYTSCSTLRWDFQGAALPP